MWVSCIITLAASKTALHSSVFISGRDLNSETRCETFWKIFIKVLRYFPPPPSLPITLFFFCLPSLQALSQEVKEQNYINCLFVPVHSNLPSGRQFLPRLFEAGKDLNFATLRSSCDGSRTDWSIQHMGASSTPPVLWCFQQMFSSHKKSCLKLLLAAWVRGMCMACQGIREKAERRRGCDGISSASLLSQRFLAARILWEADGQQGVQRCQRKSMGMYQARKSLDRAKPVGWSPAGGMGAGKSFRVGLWGESGAGLW